MYSATGPKRLRPGEALRPPVEAVDARGHHAHEGLDVLDVGAVEARQEEHRARRRAVARRSGDRAGQRSISAQRAKWMNESARRGAVTRLVSRATSHVNRTQIAHHHGIGLRMVSGVARIGVERIAHA